MAAGSVHDPALTTVSYNALEPARAALLKKMRGEIEKPGMGPETLRTLLAQMRPADLGLGQRRTRDTRSLPDQAVNRGFGNANFQHDLRAMGGARNLAASPAAHPAGALCPTTTAEADERIALGHECQRARS